MSANEETNFAMRFRFGLPETATLEDKRDFVSFRLATYRQEEQWTSDILSEYFADDFRLFTADDFKVADPDDRRKLRDLLRSRRVYVPKGRSILISDALYAVVKEEIPWPKDEIDDDNVMEDKTDQITVETQVDDPVQLTLCENTKTNSTATWIKKGNLSNLFKAYSSDDDRYSGLTQDNFDRKFVLFEERCDQADLNEDDRQRAFSIMLCKEARQYYLDTLRIQKLPLDELVRRIKERFHTPERTRALLREWDNLSFTIVKSKFPSSSLSECLEMMISKLTDIQSSLPSEYRNDTILRNKLLNSVRDVAECRLAYHKPADTVQGVISDLHASLATSESFAGSSSLQQPISAHLVDRKYYHADNSRNNSRYRHEGTNKKCFVCGKPGCWSTNHSTKSRLQALKKNKVLRQFIAELKDDSDDEDQQIVETLEDVTAHIIELTSNDVDDDPDNDKVHSHLAQIDDSDEPISFAASLQDSIVAHALTAHSPKSRFAAKFHGVLIDTGCARGSTGGMLQYKLYCEALGKTPNIDSSKAKQCHFGIGSETSKGTANISFPLGDLWLSFDVHIVTADVPILLGLPHMDELGIYFNNLTDEIVHTASGQSIKAIRKFGHAFIQWNPFLSCHFTKVELRRLHRRFGHPHVDKLINLLERSEVDSVTPETRVILLDIMRTCVACQTYAQKPRRFKFTLRDDKDFNHTVYADIFYIDAKPILHVVDEATNYQAAQWLPTVSSQSLWRALRICWIDVYLGPPDVIVHDAGKNFMAESFASNADLLHIRTKAVPVESANSMTVVERYHQPIRRAYQTIKSESPDTDDAAALQMAVKAINDSVGPDGLVPTLLVYGALPRLGLPHDKPNPSTFQRAAALRKATQEMSKRFAKRQVQSALNSRNGPDVSDVHSIPIGGHALVYRPKTDKWEGPFSVLDINGEDVTLLLPPPSGPTKFRTTVVRPFRSDDTDTQLPSDNQEPFAFSIYVNNLDNTATSFSLQGLPPKSRFRHSRQKELDGLIARGVFTIVPSSESQSFRVFGSRFVDTVKNRGTSPDWSCKRITTKLMAF